MYKPFIGVFIPELLRNDQTELLRRSWHIVLLITIRQSTTVCTVAMARHTLHRSLVFPVLVRPEPSVTSHCVPCFMALMVDSVAGNVSKRTAL